MIDIGDPIEGEFMRGVAWVSLAVTTVVIFGTIWILAVLTGAQK